MRRSINNLPAAPREYTRKHSNCRTLLRAITIVLVLYSAFASRELRGADRPPNIVLIISDDQAWTDFGFMDHPVIQTPHLDRLASESMVYTRGYVPTSLCRPSLATLMTGLYPHQHGITGNDPPGEMRDVAGRGAMVDIFRRSKPVTEWFREKGYVSHQSGKWWEGSCNDGGFTECMTHGDVSRGGRHGDDGLKIGREGMQPIYDFIDSAGGKPFFLWYAPFLPHSPHNPPEKLLENYLAEGRPSAVAKYFAMCEWLDETVGQLLGHLKEKRLAENTVVIFVTDNGWIQTADPRLWYEGRAKVSPYEGGMRTPIMVRWPGKVKPGRDEETLVSSIDLVPTMLGAAGIDPDPDLPGINLLDRAKLTARKSVQGSLFAHTAVNIDVPAANLKYRWIVRDGWKLILPYTPNRDVTLMIRGQQAAWMSFKPELYDVADDPSELHDLAQAHPDLVKSLTEDLDTWWKIEQ